jgi:uncharacterized protein
VDCAVHQEWSSLEDLHRYMTESTRRVAGTTSDPIIPSLSGGFLTPSGPLGSEPATFERMRSEILGRRRVSTAVLVHGSALNLGAVRDGYLATELAQAVNDWTAAEWLAADARLIGSIAIACQMPESAAREVRRFAQNEAMAQVLLAGNGVGKPFGHPVYHPIYEAAVETGKHIAIYAGAAGGLNPPSAGGGAVNLFSEYHALTVQGLTTHLLSLIAHGVFDLYPELRVVLIGGGVSWVPSFAWRADADFKGVRREVPWVRHLPSDYLRDRVAVTTYPLDGPASLEQMEALIRLVGKQTTILYASGYPQWNQDEPTAVRDRIPSDLRGPIMAGHARQIYSAAEPHIQAGSVPSGGRAE